MLQKKCKDINLLYKSDNSAKVDKSFESLETFRPVSILDTYSDLHSCSRKIHLEAKRITANFNVEGKKCKKIEIFSNIF